MNAEPLFLGGNIILDPKKELFPIESIFLILQRESKVQKC